MTTKISDRSKILEWEKQISTSSSDWGFSVIAAENFAREENLSSVLIPKMFKEMVEQLKRAHKLVDVVDRASRKFCVTLLRYRLDKPESSYAQMRLFARKKAEEKFHKIIFVKY